MLRVPNVLHEVGPRTQPSRRRGKLTPPRDVCSSCPLFHSVPDDPTRCECQAGFLPKLDESKEELLECVYEETNTGYVLLVVFGVVCACLVLTVLYFRGAPGGALGVLSRLVASGYVVGVLRTALETADIGTDATAVYDVVQDRKLEAFVVPYIVLFAGSLCLSLFVVLRRAQKIRHELRAATGVSPHAGTAAATGSEAAKSSTVVQEGLLELAGSIANLDAAAVAATIAAEVEDGAASAVAHVEITSLQQSSKECVMVR